MLRCIIVDDESGAIEILTRYVARTPELELVRSFRDSIEALTFLARNDVDLVFLDIDMPNLDGMQLSDLIRNKATHVIFCTAYSEYAAESYEKEAIDYLLKPIGYERFRKAVIKALKVRSGEKKPDEAGAPENLEETGKLFIKSGPRIHGMDIGKLLYVEKKGHYVVFHTSGGELLSRMNMTDLMNSLPPDNFIRIHRSFVVAVDKIDTIEKHTVVIRGKRLPIGESYRDDFFERIHTSGN
jgi:two-component system LytT family response regulator